MIACGMLTGVLLAPLGMPRVAVSADGTEFVLRPSAGSFVPWGLQRRSRRGRSADRGLLEPEWDKVAADFAQMKALGANVVRGHLQIGMFMTAADTPDAKALDRLPRLVKLVAPNRV